MNYSKKSVAYKQNSSKEAKSQNFQVIKSKPALVFGVAPLQAFILWVILVLMVGCLIYSKVALDKIGTEIVKYEKQYEDLMSEKVRLEVSMESNISLKNLEELAKEKGLCPIQDYQIEYVDFQTQDDIEVIDKKYNFYKSIKEVFNDILAYIK